jgi:hypothetical protein
MTAEQFVFQLMQRHNSKSGSAEAVLGDIKKLVTEVSLDDLDRLFSHYRDHYEKESLPRVPWFRSAMRDLGISSGQRSPWVWECLECGTLYSSQGRGCPRCRKQTQTRVVGVSEYPRETVRVQEDCYQCGLYHPRQIGPVCPSFGKTPDDPEICKVCECRQCCATARLERNDPEMYQIKMHKGELFTPPPVKKKNTA